jgi:hypothetical protein
MKLLEDIYKGIIKIVKQPKIIPDNDKNYESFNNTKSYKKTK